MGRIDYGVEGAVATLTIDNPETRNGLTTEMASAIADRVTQASEDGAVRVLVLRGAGAHFCSGADLKEGSKLFRAGPEVMRGHVEEFHRAIRALAACPNPVLAVIRGACAGFGFDIAMVCDLRVAASDQTKFGQVFTRIGLVPDGGSSYTLPRLVGEARAMELMLLAETFDGARAAELGLVNRAVPDAELDALVAAWTAKLAAGPPLAYRHAKRNLQLGAAGGTLDEALDRELESQLVCLQSGDMWRGVQAFFAKKPPEFQGD